MKQTYNKETEMRKLVSIRSISNIESIPNADRVELAHVDGWRCVVKKNDFTVGQKILFFETDCAFMNVNDERVSFLRKSCHKSWKLNNLLLGECLRIKTVKLAGQISQGLAMPVSLFEKEINESIERGISLEEAIGIRHFDELSEEMSCLMGNAPSQETRGKFPSVVPKTDEERVQNLTDYFDKFKNEVFEATIKMDGSSMSVGYSPSIYPDQPYFVCSRNLSLKTDGEDNFNRTAKKYNLEQILKKHHDETGHEICIQGELVGPGINGNHDGMKEIDYYVFRIYDITACRLFDSVERRMFCKKYGIKHVPLLSEQIRVFDLFPTVDELVKFVSPLTTDNGNPIEGIVFKTMNGNISFKVINPLYLLKND